MGKCFYKCRIVSILLVWLIAREVFEITEQIRSELLIDLQEDILKVAHRYTVRPYIEVF